MIVQIYMPLIGEGTDVWRPVKAEALPDGTHVILDTVPNEENWMFHSGTRVHCELRKFDDGLHALAAIGLVD